MFVRILPAEQNTTVVHSRNTCDVIFTLSENRDPHRGQVIRQSGHVAVKDLMLSNRYNFRVHYGVMVVLVMALKFYLLKVKQSAKFFLVFTINSKR